MTETRRLYSVGTEKKDSINNPLAFNLKLDVNWQELIDQAEALYVSVKSLGDGYEKAAAVIDEKRPGPVVGIDDEKALRSYRAMIEHYRHLQKGAEDALKSLVEAKIKWG